MGSEQSVHDVPLRSSHERFMSVSQEERSVFQLMICADHSPSLRDVDR
jgi:hypothetical protein